MSIDELKRIINFAASVAVDAGQPKIASQLDEAVNQFCQLQERLRTAEEKSGNWDYYQELLKKNGLAGITDLLTKFHALDRDNESLRQQLEAAQAEVKRLESAWHAGDLNRKDEIIARQEAENDRLKAIIKKAQEQNVAYWTDGYKIISHLIKQSYPIQTQGYAIDLYALPPIPAEHGEDWKPIETAPKTGRKLLLSLLNVAGKRRTIVGFWVERFTMEDDGDADESDVDEKDGTYYWGEGWYESLESHDDFSCLYAAQDSITHFMPLPSAPQSGVKPS